MESSPTYHLAKHFLAGQLNEAEQQQFYLLLQDPKRNEELLDALELLTGQVYATDQTDERMISILQGVTRIDKPNADLKSVANSLPATSYSRPAVRRIHFLKTPRFRYAAAAILVFGVAAYFWTASKTTDQTLAARSKPRQTDIAPGGERAILTLANGQTIVLDSAANGHLADQAGAGIVKLANGQIAYHLQGAPGGEVTWNTMSTPRGGQYRLTLPDGTDVWLNAASSITYPVVFMGTERKVKVTGEAYFEVAKSKEKTFLIDVDGQSTVQVLGTSFNINSYRGEGSIKTTLLEGRVKVIRGAATDDKRSGSVILKPGQQVQIPIEPLVMPSEQKLTVANNIDIEKVLAWKNGIFNFEDASLKEVILQLERWYDIQVKYEGRIPDVQFNGKMNRGVKLTTILNWFSDLGIKTRIEGKTLVVL